MMTHNGYGKIESSDFIFISHHLLPKGVSCEVLYENSLLQKKAAAVELIKTRLSETPNDPRLWYVLGFLLLIVLTYQETLFSHVS